MVRSARLFGDVRCSAEHQNLTFGRSLTGRCQNCFKKYPYMYLKNCKNFLGPFFAKFFSLPERREKSLTLQEFSEFVPLCARARSSGAHSALDPKFWSKFHSIPLRTPLRTNSDLKAYMGADTIPLPRIFFSVIMGDLVLLN